MQRLIEYRICGNVSRKKIAKSAISTVDRLDSVRISLARIKKSKGSGSERLGKRQVIEVSVTKIYNDKALDQMLTIEGVCLKNGRKIRAILFPPIEKTDGNYGHLKME